MLEIKLHYTDTDWITIILNYMNKFRLSSIILAILLLLLLFIYFIITLEFSRPPVDDGKNSNTIEQKINIINNNNSTGTHDSKIPTAEKVDIPQQKNENHHLEKITVIKKSNTIAPPNATTHIPQGGTRDYSNAR